MEGRRKAHPGHLSLLVFHPVICRKQTNTQLQNRSSKLIACPCQVPDGCPLQQATLLQAAIQTRSLLPSCGSAVPSTWLPRPSCSSVSSQGKRKTHEGCKWKDLLAKPGSRAYHMPPNSTGQKPLSWQCPLAGGAGNRSGELLTGLSRVYPLSSASIRSLHSLRTSSG